MGHLEAIDFGEPILHGPISKLREITGERSHDIAFSESIDTPPKQVFLLLKSIARKIKNSVPL